jgi:hypothetical protein
MVKPHILAIQSTSKHKIRPLPPYVKPTWAPVGCRKNRTTSVSGVFWEENIGSGSLKGQHLSHIYSGNGEMYWFYTCLRTY